MYRGHVFFVLFISLCSLSVATWEITKRNQANASAHQKWNKYKNSHGKNYSHPVHDEVRKQRFFNHSSIVDNHNERFKQGKHSYDLEINKYSDWTESELDSLSGTIHIDPKHFQPTHKLNSSSIQKRGIPTSKDWRTAGAVSPIKDQGQCGSCYAFASVAALEGHRALKYGNMQELSEQQVIDCSKSYGDNGCGGGHPYYVYNYLIDSSRSKNYIQQRKCYNYFSGQTLDAGTCKAMSSPSCAGGQITGQRYMQNENDLLTAVANYGPVVVLVDSSPATFLHYKSGVYDDPSCSTTRYDHAVLCVGYGTENGQNYWLIKNSWGTGWGDNGYMKLARGKNQCAVALFSAFPVL